MPPIRIAGPQGTTINTTKQNTIRQGTNKDGQGYLIGGKESQVQAKESETNLLPQLVAQKFQAMSYNIYAKNLMQTPAGPMLAPSVFVSSYIMCLVDLVDHVPLMFTKPFDSYSLPPPLFFLVGVP